MNWIKSSDELPPVWEKVLSIWPHGGEIKLVKYDGKCWLSDGWEIPDPPSHWCRITLPDGSHP